MPLWDKVKQELDRAGQVAQDAIDEGRIRLEAQRTRRLADRAAQVLGYAVYRARQAGTPLDDAELARHSAKVAEYEAEAQRQEAQIAEIQRRWRAPGTRGPGGGPDTPPSAWGGMGRPDPLDPTPAPPASATTPNPPETSATTPDVGATTESVIDFDPWHRTDRSGPDAV